MGRQRDYGGKCIVISVRHGGKVSTKPKTVEKNAHYEETSILSTDQMLDFVYLTI